MLQIKPASMETNAQGAFTTAGIDANKMKLNDRFLYPNLIRLDEVEEQLQLVHARCSILHRFSRFLTDVCYSLVFSPNWCSSKSLR